MIHTMMRRVQVEYTLERVLVLLRQDLAERGMPNAKIVVSYKVAPLARSDVLFADRSGGA